jgi:hypothetical protein
MNREERSKFIDSYSKVLTQAWADASFLKSLQASPAAILNTAGITVPPGVTVNIITKTAGEGTLEDQIRIWEEGLKKGSADLYVPAEPQLGDGELSDSQLEAIAGGGDCCCTCTPCCCCG